MARTIPNLFTIAPDQPFLEQLARSWLAGELDVGDVADPLVRLDTVFYLPTRRAARAFGDVLLQQMGTKAGGDTGMQAALLPTIRTLADAGEEELFEPAVMAEDPDQLATEAEGLDARQQACGPLATMPALKRRLILTRLIEAAGRSMEQAMSTAGHGSSDQPIFPQSLGESAFLAKALAALIDQVATEECNWQALFDLVPDDHAAYWQITLTLLQLVSSSWPAILADEGCVDPATRRALLLDQRTAQLLAAQEKGLPTGPVIAAGSTGSIPATARLLAAIARSRQGAVVLPGLDLTMPEETFATLDSPSAQSASHAQFGLARLLPGMNASRSDVVPLGGVAGARLQALSHALLPAGATGNWPDLRMDAAEAQPAFAGVSLLEAASEGEEGLAIAMAMKASLARGQSVALVTPDRNLARRVQLDLARFGLASDDSAGMPLNQSTPARLLMLAAEAARDGFAAIGLLGLLKHPLCALGQSRPATRADARLLERLALRGMALPPGLQALRDGLALRAGERNADGRKAGAGRRKAHVPALRRGLGAIEEGRALGLVGRLEEAFAPLLALPDPASFAAYGQALFQVAQAICDEGPDKAGVPNALYGGPAGEALAALLAGLRQAQDVGLSARLHEAPDLLAALLADGVVRPAGPADPRLAIWGPLEARLQAVDHVILGGLNEKAWPALPKASPFLSRAMMAGMGLEVPERRIGLSAHDVEQAMAQPLVTLCRAAKVDGTPTVASRWLQRLLAFLPADTSTSMRGRAAPLLKAAREADACAQSAPCARPAPRPARPPTRLSITDVETLIRDPFSIYAKRVLKLEEAPGLGLPPGPAERGTLFHGLFEALAADLDALPQEQWHRALDRHAQALLLPYAPFADIQALWSRRIERLAPHYLAQESQWQDGLLARLPERDGQMRLSIAGQDCVLSGRADRIDLHDDQSATILDFKTGDAPSAKQVKLGLAPQLPLAAAMLQADTFENTPALPTRAAHYVKVSGNKDAFKLEKSIGSREEIEALAGGAMEQLRALWASYLTGRPFEPLVRPLTTRFASPYHQLARVKEWRMADEDNGSPDE